jgi:hypothetical protein
MARQRDGHFRVVVAATLMPGEQEPVHRNRPVFAMREPARVEEGPP